MKQFWKKIIVSTIMIAIFLAPISAGIKIDKKNNLAINIEIKETEAQITTKGCGETVPCVYIEEVNINRNSAKFNLKIVNIKGKFPPAASSASITVRLTGNTTESITITDEVMSFPIADQNMEETETKTLCIGQSGCDYNNSEQLTANTGYTLITGISSTESKFSFWTATEGSGQEGSAGNLRAYQIEEDFDCDIMPPDVNLGGCVLQIFFYLWQASALVATLAGHFLDFFIYYATDSASYINTFVSKAWGAVRDVANIFFIIALLYVAIKTILGLNVTDNKKLISAVIIVGLIINFSLFTTKVVIDGSNILAKIFYNNITSTKAGSTDAAIEAGGEKSISIGLVDKFDPQNIVMDAYKGGLGLGYAIFLTLLLMAVTLYTAYIFFSVALLFVARIVSLWISMIFSPIAFASYTVPFEIPGFGHKEWWKGLLENAFLAPLFIFFLYIIVMFTEFLGEITKYQSDPSLSDFTSTIRRLMTMIIPFIIIVMLLTKAKKLAVKLSGDMGAAIMTGAKLVGGLALGAATGGTALALRSTAGRGLAAAANSGIMKKWEAKGYGGGMARSVLKAGGKGSFDLRGIKIAGKDLSSTGLKVNALPGKLGKTQEGGWEKTRKDKVEKRQKRAQELKVGEDEKLKQEVNKTEQDLQKLLNENSKELVSLDKTIETKRQSMNDNRAIYGRDSQEAKTAGLELANAKRRKKALKEGKNYDGDDIFEEVEKEKEIKTGVFDANGKEIIRKEKYKESEQKKKTGTEKNYSEDKYSMGIYIDEEGKEQKRTIDYIETKELVNKKHLLEEENRKRLNRMAKTIEGNWFTKVVAGRGGKANREAGHKIRMDVKLDSGTKN